MENNENMNNQVNENNNVQEEKKNNSKTIGTVILIMGLLLLGLAAYKIYIEKSEPDKPKENNTQEQENNQVNDNAITKLEEVLLDENNKEIIINDKKLLIKEVDGNLYVNDAMLNYEYGFEKIYLTNKYLVIKGGGQISAYPAIINENGELVLVSGNPDAPTASIDNLRLENGKLIATKYYDIDEMNLDNTKEMNVELVYENGVAQFVEYGNSNTPQNDNTQDNGNNETQDDEKYKAYDFDEYVNSMQSAIQFKYEYASEELPRELDIMNDTYNIY